MQSLDEVHKTLEALKKERREISKSFRDELSQNERHKELNETLKDLREEKKRIENEIMTSSLGQKDRVDEIKSEVQALNELISDIALNMYMDNKEIEIIDENDVKYYPVFSVTFKKE